MRAVLAISGAGVLISQWLDRSQSCVAVGYCVGASANEIREASANEIRVLKISKFTVIFF